MLLWTRLSCAQALAAIHEAGFLHGDVRSDNLIFEEGTGRVSGQDCNCEFLHGLHGLGQQSRVPAPPCFLIYSCPALSCPHTQTLLRLRCRASAPSPTSFPFHTAHLLPALILSVPSTLPTHLRCLRLGRHTTGSSPFTGSSAMMECSAVLFTPVYRPCRRSSWTWGSAGPAQSLRSTRRRWSSCVPS